MNDRTPPSGLNPGRSDATRAPRHPDATRAPAHRFADVLTGLLIPADPQCPCTVLVLRNSSPALSEAIGGGLIEDAYYGRICGQGYCLYLDDEREAKRLPENARAVLLAARLSWVDQIDRLRLRGDALLTGTARNGDDADVPEALLAAARRTGLLPDPATPAPDSCGTGSCGTDSCGTSPNRP